jgi:hypothetical protein
MSVRYMCYFTVVLLRTMEILFTVLVRWERARLYIADMGNCGNISRRRYIKCTYWSFVKDRSFTRYWRRLCLSNLCLIQQQCLWCMCVFVCVCVCVCKRERERGGGRGACLPTGKDKLRNSYRHKSIFISLLSSAVQFQRDSELLSHRWRWSSSVTVTDENSSNYIGGLLHPSPLAPFYTDRPAVRLLKATWLCFKADKFCRPKVRCNLLGLRLTICRCQLAVSSAVEISSVLIRSSREKWSVLHCSLLRCCCHERNSVYRVLRALYTPS